MIENVFHYKCGCGDDNVETYGIQENRVEFTKDAKCHRCGKVKELVKTVEVTLGKAIIKNKEVDVITDTKTIMAVK